MTFLDLNKFNNEFDVQHSSYFSYKVKANFGLVYNIHIIVVKCPNFSYTEAILLTLIETLL